MTGSRAKQPISFDDTGTPAAARQAGSNVVGKPTDPTLRQDA